MKLGDVVENAIWVTGDEPEGMKDKYKKDAIETIEELCKTYGFIHGEIVFSEKRPNEDRVPEVPDHIQGSCVRLLVLEATLVKKTLQTTEDSFVNNLERKDLVKLRKITRDVVKKHYHRMINNEECDDIIESLGADAALEAMRTVH